MSGEQVNLTSEQRRERAQRWLREGKSISEVQRLAEAEGWHASRGWVSGERQKVTGGPGEPVEATVARQVRGLADGPGLAQEAPQRPAGGIDYRAEVRAMYSRAKALADSADGRVQAAALQQQLRLLEQLRELDHAEKAAAGPRVVFYFPERTELARLEVPEEG